jgi:hypothetical protein
MYSDRVLALGAGIVAAAIAALGVMAVGGFGSQAGSTDRWASETHHDEAACRAAPHYGDSEAKKGSPRAHISYERPQLSVYSAPWPPKLPPPDLTLKDLADQAQARVVAAEADRPQQAAQLREDLAQAFTTKSRATEALQDPFKFDRTLIATVTKGTASHPGDRMIWTRIFIKPLNFSFMNYAIDPSEIETEKVASLEDAVTGKISGTLRRPETAGVTANVAPELEHSRKTNVDLDQQYQKVGIDIQPKFLRIYRESERGKDVIGNTLINLSLIADSTMATQDIVLIGLNPHLYDGIVPLEETTAALDVHPQQLILHCPLIARVWMVYEKRDVVAGRNHYAEEAQTVSLVRDASTVDDDDEPGIVSKVVDADSVSPAIWQVSAPDGSGAVMAGVDPKTPRRLLFTDYGVATLMAHWLKEKGAKSIAKVQLTYSSDAGLVATKRPPTDAEKAACAGL